MIDSKAATTQADQRYAAEALFVEFERLERLCAETGDAPGRATTLDWDLEYTSPTALLAFVDQILFRRLNDFVADGDAPVIIDCGANIGYTSLHYKRCYPKARIVAIEPDPQFLPLLLRNLERNGGGDIEVVPAAAWTGNGFANWVMEGKDGSRLDDGASGGQVVTVPTVDLRHYLRTPVDLLKLDIEGAEFDVVPHIAPSLERVRNIVVECHITDQTKYDGLAKLMTTLTTAGFRISVNSYGPWRDLTRRHTVAPLHAEQYLTVYGWRGETAPLSTEPTHLPYVGLEHYRQAAGFSGAQRHSEDIGRAVAELVKGSSAAIVHRIEGPFRKERGNCWHYRLPDSFPAGDSNESRESTTLVLEDSRALGPGHAPHDDIRSKGGGRYSHWGNSLYLSTADNSDPNTNGRVYTLLTFRSREV
jgi:FkbM family methyltransferase